VSAWIESHQTLRDHPKKDALAEALFSGSVPDDVADYAAVGLLQHLWWWALDYAQDGDISPFSDRQIARACRWSGDPACLVSALLSSGFLTEDRYLNDWHDYAGKLIERRERNRERMRDARSQAQKDTVAARAQNSVRTCKATEPNPTKENQEHMSTAGAALAPDPEDDDLFGQFWQAYPRKVGRAVALKRWRRLSARDRQSAIVAAANIATYVGDTGAELQYVPQGDTFLGPQEKWKEWAEGAPAGYSRPGMPGTGPPRRPSCQECESDLTWDEDGEHCPVCGWRAT
jgi:hypothetical protein